MADRQPRLRIPRPGGVLEQSAGLGLLPLHHNDESTASCLHGAIMSGAVVFMCRETDPDLAEGSLGASHPYQVDPLVLAGILKTLRSVL